MRLINFCFNETAFKGFVMNNDNSFETWKVTDRVYGISVFPYLEMEMGSGYISGRSAECDVLTFVYSFSAADCDFAEMSVVCIIAVVMLYLYQISVAAVVACEYNDSSVRSIHPGSRRSPEIHSQMKIIYSVQGSSPV